MIRRTLLALAAAAPLGGTPVFAQGLPGNGEVAPQLQPTQDGYQQPGRGAGPGRMRQLHDQLGITPAQQPQWDAVVATLRANAGSMRASPALQAVRSGQMNAVQEVHALADLARERADAAQRLVAPVEALYAALSPQQRVTADQMLEQMMHHGPGRAGTRRG